ncbi:hypothetical protein JIX56_20105 [Streptomyces sp. CA-210063]|uniref:hypothetical protein n=1 Tax=Streptomyces sp. CA-210063 TaxID=2801029 RepID=UPI00214B2D0A|nr:hypothetical protein [Streptomyces sp. CA-210063]UUU32024.1 hypothetical protein JIX56_20105 [Streptomyces sp. CA-210063]
MKHRARARCLLGLTAVTALLAFGPVGVAAADSEDTSTAASVSSHSTEQPTEEAGVSSERLLADISW